MQLNKDSKESLFKLYVSEALKIITNNTNMGAGEFSSLAVSYSDLIAPSEDKEDSNKKAKKIISNIKSKLNKLSRKEE